MVTYHRAILFASTTLPGGFPFELVLARGPLVPAECMGKRRAELLRFHLEEENPRERAKTQMIRTAIPMEHTS